MTPKQVAFVGAVCVTVGWLLASTVSPPVARLQTRTAERPARQAAEDPRFTEQLQLRLNDVRETPDNRRNPFVFATAEPAAAPPAAITPEPQIPSDIHSPFALPDPVAPRFVLSGIGISGDVRTAVISVGEDVRIVRVNEELEGHTVAEITESTVVLVRGGKRQLLRLPQ